MIATGDTATGYRLFREVQFDSEGTNTIRREMFCLYSVLILFEWQETQEMLSSNIYIFINL